MLNIQDVVTIILNNMKCNNKLIITIILRVKFKKLPK